MSIQVQGSGGVVVDVNGSTFRAMVVTLRPVEYGLLGSYRVSAISGTIAPGLAAAAEIYQFRWTATPQLALIWGFQIDGLSSDGTPFLANGSSVGMNIARSWTADGSGGTTITPTGNTGKLRTSMGTSLVGSMRIASTAALGAGTKTVDPQPASIVFFLPPTVANSIILPQVGYYGYNAMNVCGNQAPVVLSRNEGLTYTVSIDANGNWQFGVTVAWSEVSSY